MALDVQPIELALLTTTWDDNIAASDAAALAKLVVDGAFRDALTSPQAKRIFTVSASDADSELATWLALPDGADADEELARLTLAVASLHAFLQANWTGPDLDVAPLDILTLPPSLSALSASTLHAKSVADLALRGEPAYHLAQHPTFLQLSHILLASTYTHCRSVGWWRLRVAAVHSQVLDEPVPLPSSVFDGAVPTSDDPDVRGRLLLEKGLLHHHIGDDRAAAAHFADAARATGLKYELTGALGKRTKFQTFDTSQLVLLAESRPRDSSPTAPPAPAAAPETLALNDDTLLEQPFYTLSSGTGHLAHLDPGAQPALHPLDQSVLLALCASIRRTSPTHGLTHEQMAPYAARVLAHPRNWSVHTTALLLRARAEAARTRTAERAVLQLQALVDQMPSADAPVSARLAFVHALALPSKWALERELAGRMLTLGAVRSAMGIYERLELWEDVVRCHQVLERGDLAQALVRELLDGARADADVVLAHAKAGAEKGSRRRVGMDRAREAKLWCLLGDIDAEHAQEHYEKAWAVSGQSSGRAMRALGAYKFAHADYAGARDSLAAAVKINPLLSRSWFVLGCAHTRLEEWNGAREAFARCVALDDADAESWSNLASTYLRMSDAPAGADGSDAAPQTIPFSNKLLAFRALQHGLKSAYENWRMWSNFAVIAVDVGELAEAARALGRLAELRAATDGAACVDADVLDRLVAAASRPPPEDPDGQQEVLNVNEGKGLMPRVLDLFERVLLPRLSDARVFRAYARVLTAQQNYAGALGAHMDAYRASPAAALVGADATKESFAEAVEEVLELVEVLRNFGPRVEEGRKWVAQARSVVRSFMGRMREGWEDEEGWGRLVECLEELKSEQ